MDLVSEVNVENCKVVNLSKWLKLFEENLILKIYCCVTYTHSYCVYSSLTNTPMITDTKHSFEIQENH